MEKRYAVAGKILLSRLRTFLAFPEWFYLQEPVNTMTPPRSTPGGLATQFSSAGHFDLAEDQAMIVTVPAAGAATAPYQGIQLGSMWYVSLDYISHQTSLTADQARIDPDGQLRFVISERDPGVANWLELTGHRRGYVQIRWQRLTRDLMLQDGPQVQVIPFAEIAGRLPYYQQARVSPEEWRARIAGRSQRPSPPRPPDPEPRSAPPVNLGRPFRPAGGSVGSNDSICQTICAGHSGGAGPRRSTPLPPRSHMSRLPLTSTVVTSSAITGNTWMVMAPEDSYPVRWVGPGAGPGGPTGAYRRVQCRADPRGTAVGHQPRR